MQRLVVGLRFTDGLLSLQVDKHMAFGSRMFALQASSNHD